MSPLAIPVDPRTAPEACTTMTDVRQGVDALDRALVALLSERQRYMDAAARIKPRRDLVRDEDRIEDVVAKVKASAERDGFNPALAETLWRTLIEGCIAHELARWDALRADQTATAAKI
jgi:isochorismate pyruvate lyase